MLERFKTRVISPPCYHTKQVYVLLMNFFFFWSLHVVSSLQMSDCYVISLLGLHHYLYTPFSPYQPLLVPIFHFLLISGLLT